MRASGVIMTIEALRRGCQALHHELALAYHNAGAGLSESLGTTAILDRYADFATLDRLAEVSAALARTSDPVEARRLTYLRDHVAWLYDAHRCRALVDSIHAAEGSAEIEVEGQTYAYRELSIRVQNEPDRAQRARLAAARDELTWSIEPQYREQHRLWQAIARELGFADHTARCAALGGLPLESLAAVCQTLLVETEALYRDALRPAFARIGVPADEAASHDLAYLFRINDYDALFTSDQLVPRMRAMCEAMWLDIDAGGRVTFDLEDRPLKSPRPFCSVIQVPQQVVLVLRPVGGLNDYAAFLHELGHALHFSHTSADLPWEFRYLGDNSVTESYAFVFDRLTVDELWLMQVIGLDDPKPVSQILALRELMMVRKYAAQMLYELELFAVPEAAPMAERWRERIEPATGVRQTTASYLTSVDPLYYSARYLQGWLFEAALHEHLVSCFGRRWFAAPEAGRFLTELYQRGQAEPVTELFDVVRCRPLDPGPLLRRARRELG